MANDLDIIGGTVASVDTTTYCVNADLEEEFGIATVNKWANLTGSMTDPEIAAAKDKQRLKAFDYCNSKLRGGAYETIPIPVDDRPEIISKVEAMVAGAFLLKKRPIAKEDDGAASVKALLKDADDLLRDIRRGFYVTDAAISRGMSFGDGITLCDHDCCLHQSQACYYGCACQCSDCQHFISQCLNVTIVNGA